MNIHLGCTAVHKILVLDTDADERKAFGNMLEQENFAAILAGDPKAALDSLHVSHVQLAVIDLPLPGISGLELCLQIRASKIPTPVMVLSSSCEEIDKILMLEAGADDYLVKPFGTREFIARVRALLRRTTLGPSRTIRFDDVEIDPERRRITRQGGDVALTPCEYNLLLFFIENANRALTRDALLNSVWGYDQYPNTRTVDAHVSKLRNKFEPVPSAPRHFLTIHGVGYRFVM